MSKIRQPTFKVPNDLIQNGSLSFNARRMGAVLYSRRNALGTCRRSLASLAWSAQCSIATARKALDELENAGYIRKERTYRYHDRFGRLVYDKTAYHCDLTFRRGFTLIPRSIFAKELSASAFCVYLYLHQQAGNGSRAFPSLSRICDVLWMSISTVCRAVQSLGELGMVLIQHCLKTNHAFSNNSYFFLRPAPAAPAASPSCRTQSPKRQLSGTALFPWLKYILLQRPLQALSCLWGTFKISKLPLRLR